jgi:hypothetical protein
LGRIALSTFAVQVLILAGGANHLHAAAKKVSSKDLGSIGITLGCQFSETIPDSDKSSERSKEWCAWHSWFRLLAVSTQAPPPKRGDRLVLQFSPERSNVSVATSNVLLNEIEGFHNTPGIWSTQEKEPYAVIDGSKNPDLFPQWYVWEMAFHWLDGGSTESRRPIPLHREIGISETELKFLMDQVKAFKQLQEALSKQLVETRGAAIAQGKREDDIRLATEQVNLDYRYRVLDLRQRIYDQLPTMSLIRLVAWIDPQLAGTTVHLRGRAVQFFRQPW